MTALSEPMTANGTPLLSVRGLRVNFFTARGQVHAVRDVSFDVEQGTTLGVVGESGSGKSVTAISLMGLVAVPGRVDAGTILWRGQDVSDERALRRAERERELLDVAHGWRSYWT